MYGTYTRKENESIYEVIIISLMISYDNWKEYYKSSFNLLLGVKLTLQLSPF